MLERRRFFQGIRGGWLLDVGSWVGERWCGYGLEVGDLRWRQEGMDGVLAL